MAWDNTTLTFSDAFNYDAATNTITGTKSDRVCMTSYKTSKQTVYSTVGSVTSITTYTTVDATYVANGFTETAARATADSFNQHPGFFAEAHKAYSSDGWDVSVTQHTTTSTTETQPVGGGNSGT